MFLLLLLLCSLFAIAIADAVNRTVDHSAPFLLYRPPQAWHTRTRPGCNSTCSWHEATPLDDNQQTSLQFNFTGIAVYLYTIPSQSPSNLSFTLDGQPWLPDTRSHAHIYALRNLLNTRHTLLVTVEPDSTFSFDYLIYTYEATPTIQPRQADSSNSTDNSSQLSAQTPSSTPSSSPTGSNSSQIGAIAGAIAASIGITSLFSLGLAVSIIKIRRQRLRVRREREAELERSRGLALHLPSASVAARDPPRYPSPPTDSIAVQSPPPYDSVMARTGRNPTLLSAMGFTAAHRPGHLATIEEVLTIRSTQTSRLSRREPIIRDDSLDGVPNAPPGLTDTSSEETIRVSHERHPSPPVHNHQE